MKNNLSKKEVSEKRHFDKLAEEYDSNYQYKRPFTQYKIAKKSLDFVDLIKSVSSEENLRMLEIGCGTGEYTKQVAPFFPNSKIIGLDISEKILDIARKKCKDIRNVSFVVRSAYKTGFRDDQFDVVYGFYVLHHLEISKLKKEMLRILKPGGYVFFYEPNIFNPIVFLIKSNKFLKKMVRDSPNEGAINPVKIGKYLDEFKILNITMTEFIWPFNIIPVQLLIPIDKTTNKLRYNPVIKYLSGSVQIFLQKK